MGDHIPTILSAACVKLNLLAQLNLQWSADGQNEKRLGDGYTAGIFGVDRESEGSRCIRMRVLTKTADETRLTPGLYLDHTLSLNRYTLFRLNPEGDIHLIKIITGAKCWWLHLLIDIEIELRLDARMLLILERDYYVEQLAVVNAAIARFDEALGETDEHDQRTAADSRRPADAGAQA